MQPSVLAPVKIVAVSTHLPNMILSNEELAAIFDGWSAEKIYEKTGIRNRRIAEDDETALDLGTAAAEKLFATGIIAREEIDYLIFCTQAADYILPTSACVMQHRLGLKKSVGALDITLGCSGFVYGLSLASGLISGGMASKILLVTADTYSKFIHPRDRSVRTLFGDGAAATLIARTTLGDSGAMGHFVFGTDGSGAHDLIVETGGSRLTKTPQTAEEKEDDSGNIRSRDNLYMNGGAVMNFTLREVPAMFAQLKLNAELQTEDFDFVIMHQANLFMLEALRKKLKIGVEQTPYYFEEIGNTVSSTIPFVLESMYGRQLAAPGKKAALLGFGVGLSWAGCVLEF